ncbi:integrase arm-type DNA-binding domain-containing protein [Psychromarinibacter sp. C21-152]|uniref:Integrase arm-type DNA-binding domain-containing protein n=2 Tax=Psychromarinibacter sediminicola TaxID=3033385 RepID=A0AAE3NR23_9RHOB|nr:integrase arm-type DNA-binding domain-containing protein [Psychromarinibacter sediminicola]
MPRLTVRKVDALREPGMYGDGDGLYLRVGPFGAKSWILRTRINGRLTAGGKPLRWEGGLGSVSLVSLAEAREAARELRKIARAGGDPGAHRNREALTFEQAARRVHSSLAPTWRNPKHSQTWLSSIENYALPEFGRKPIQDVTTADVHAALAPIWTEKHETAKRLKQRISSVFDWAKGAGHFEGENPVNGLKKALPPVKHKAKNMAALPWREVPGFFSALKERDSISALALQFIILTAGRSGEVRGARWSEIEGDIWTVPGERMKRGEVHRVPLSAAALEVLESARGLDPDFIFPSPSRGKSGQARPLSDMAFKPTLIRMGFERISVHGMRSAFRDWASESAHAEREVAEAALSHAVGNAVERAYARSDLFERRRALMEAWGSFCCGRDIKVVELVS